MENSYSQVTRSVLGESLDPAPEQVLEAMETDPPWAPNAGKQNKCHEGAYDCRADP